MFSLNRATILGNATRDPEMRYTPNGKGVVHFAVATNRRWKDQSGEFQEEVEFHEISAWAGLAETINNYVKKGNKVYIEGRLRTHSWEAPDGSKRQRTEIVADNLILLTPKGSTSDYSSNKPSEGVDKIPQDEINQDKPLPKEADQDTKKSKTETKTKEKNKESSEDINLDDIPF